MTRRHASTVAVSRRSFAVSRVAQAVSSNGLPDVSVSTSAMRNPSLEFMQANFGKAGAYYYWVSRGVDNREVRANRIRKSVGAENTFSSDLTEFDAMAAELRPLIDKVWLHCGDKGSRGRTVTLKMKFNDFEIITRSRSVLVAVSSRSDLERLSITLLQNEMPVAKPVRLLGVSLSSFQTENETEPQLDLPI
jgi:DNA polymerase-4